MKLRDLTNKGKVYILNTLIDEFDIDFADNVDNYIYIASQILKRNVLSQEQEYYLDAILCTAYHDYPDIVDALDAGLADLQKRMVNNNHK